VISLGRIERLQRNDLRHNRAGKYLGFFELCDVGFRDFLLIVAAIENYGTILCAVVRPLPFLFC